MKVCLAQINPTPGDFAGNLAQIREGVDQAAEDGADLLVFPELAIPGYLSQDLMYHPDYVPANRRSLDAAAAYAAAKDPQLTLVVGLIEANPGPGKPFANIAVAVRGGRVICRYQKQRLPFYDVFDELRYFAPGTEPGIFEVCGRKLGLVICEDLWDDKDLQNHASAPGPAAACLRLGAEILVSINSSPFVHHKPKLRLEQTGRNLGERTLIYVNQRGGQDELVFDGHSFVLHQGELKAWLNDPMQNIFQTLDLAAAAPLAAGPNLSVWADRHAASLRSLLVLGLRDYAQKSGFESLVLASSGGVDSALVASLAVEALGPDKVHAVRMPSRFSSRHSVADALALHRQLGCRDYEVPIQHDEVIAFLRKNFSAGLAPESLLARQLASDAGTRTADQNIQARLRDLYVMYFSNASGAMALATGNKTESACGYYTHFDMNFSYAPIKDLYKHQVVALARRDPKIPPRIWQKPPSAELAEGQLDESSLLPYAILDPLVQAHVEDHVSTLAAFRSWVADRAEADDSRIFHDARLQAWLASGEAEAEHARIIRLIGMMEYKRRQTCPGTKVSRVAFGTGRRVPVVEKWS